MDKDELKKIIVDNFNYKGMSLKEQKAFAHTLVMCNMTDDGVIISANIEHVLRIIETINKFTSYDVLYNDTVRMLKSTNVRIAHICVLSDNFFESENPEYENVYNNLISLSYKHLDTFEYK